MSRLTISMSVALLLCACSRLPAQNGTDTTGSSGDTPAASAAAASGTTADKTETDSTDADADSSSPAPRGPAPTTPLPETGEADSTGSEGFSSEAPVPPAAAPAAPAEPEGMQDLLEQVRLLQKRLKELEATTTRLRDQVETQQKTTTANTESIGKLIPLIDGNMTAIEKLRDRATAAETRLDDHDDSITAAGELAEENEQKLKAIVIPDGSGSYMVDLSAKMDRNPAFQEELQRSVQGRLFIHNSSGTARRLFINGTAWEAREGRSFVWCPVGKVTVHRSSDHQAVSSDAWRFVRGADGLGQWELHYYIGEDVAVDE